MSQEKGFRRQLVLHTSPTESALLEELIRRHGTEDYGLTQLEMLEEVDRAKSTISEAVKWLEENDLVEREKRDGKPDLVVLKNPELFDTL